MPCAAGLRPPRRSSGTRLPRALRRSPDSRERSCKGFRRDPLRRPRDRRVRAGRRLRYLACRPRYLARYLAVVTGAVGLVVAAVQAVRRGVSAAVAFVRHTIAAGGAAVASSRERSCKGFRRDPVRLPRDHRAGAGRRPRYPELGHPRRQPGGGQRRRRAPRRRRGRMFVWRTIAACGTAFLGFARAVVREFAHAIARTIGFVSSCWLPRAAHARGGGVDRDADPEHVALLAGAIAAIAWALVLGLWTPLKGTARLLGAGVRAVPRRPGRHLVRRARDHRLRRGDLCLARAAGRDVHASFARTSTLIQRGSDATAARYVTVLRAIGRNLSASLAAGASAASRGVASVTALTGALGQAALVDVAAARVAIADAATVAGRGSTSLFWRLYEEPCTRPRASSMTRPEPGSRWPACRCGHAMA